MRFYPGRFGLPRSLVALAVSLALVLSTGVFAFASFSPSTSGSSGSSSAAQKQSNSPQVELQVTSATASASAAGVMLHWTTDATLDNLGFNVYRITNGQRTRVNREIIPGALFASGVRAQMRGGYSYSWFDRSGTSNATYFIESVNVDGVAKIHEAINPVTSKTASEFEQTPETLSGGSTSATASTDRLEKYYPAAQSQQQTGSLSGTIQAQWAIAGQTALKIAIRKDGWYRVTQQQMVAVGFNPTVDIQNLRLFVDATEVAINTNQFSGQFGSGDYIEFYGRGLDTPTTDTRIYYLIAGTTAGKRVRGELQLDEDPLDPPGPTSTPLPTSIPPASTPITPTSTGPLLRDPVFFSWVDRGLRLMWESLSSAPSTTSRDSDAQRTPIIPNTNSTPDNTSPDNSQPESGQANSTHEVKPEQDRSARAVGRSKRNDVAPLASVVDDAALSTPPKAIKSEAFTTARAPATGRHLRKSRGSKKSKRSRQRRRPRQERNHAVPSGSFAPANFDYTIETKDRLVYFSSLLNGDDENFFGRVISFSPITQTFTVSNPDLTAAGSATLEFALQGVLSPTGAFHQVSVAFNGITIGSLDFSPLEHPVRTFSIPMAQVHSGSNNVTFTKTSTGESCIVDYVRFTYPHAFSADAGSLKFNLRGSQTLKVDGFSTPMVRLIDYTDPLNVGIAKPESEPSSSGYAITVPMTESRSKEQRLLYAIPQEQFDQPAALSLNQPSSLNLNSNSADFLIISHKNFMSSMGPLASKRQSEGLATAVVDIEDVYDEFGYGLHGPQAIKAFLQHAATHWTTTPRYIIFAGDASLDPRNYFNLGDFDFVPTKLVDTLFEETATDDWLADFDDDGVADIPVGRLPVRTIAEADLIVSKIVSYSPATVPQAAILIADDPVGGFDFEVANDNVQALLPASMTVQRVNVRTEGAAQATIDIRDGINQGRAIVNYSGHGNVDVWSSQSIWRPVNATALTNGMNKLTFVVVMDCLNGYFQDPILLSLSEAFLKAPDGGAVAVFASSGKTFTFGQRQMELELYARLYDGQPMALGDAIKIAKGATFDIDVRRSWIYFGDPSLKIR